MCPIDTCARITDNRCLWLGAWHPAVKSVNNLHILFGTAKAEISKVLLESAGRFDREVSPGRRLCAVHNCSRRMLQG